MYIHEYHVIMHNDNNNVYCVYIGGGTMKAAATNDRVHPPDKKKFERETAEINRKIKELEAKLVSLRPFCQKYEVVFKFKPPNYEQ